MPDRGLAQLSDNLLFATVLCYALAMLGYAAELAFGRRPRGASAPAAAPEREPVLVGATAPAVSVGAGGSTGADAGGAPAAPATGTATGAAGPDGPARRSAAPARPGGPAYGDGRGSGPAAGLGRLAVALTLAGWVLHVGSVVSRGFAAHRVPWGNMYEFSSMITLVAVTTYLALLLRQRIQWLGVFVMVPVVLYLGAAGTLLYAPAGPLVPALDSYWLKIHVVAAIVASGVFIVSAVTTVLYLLKERWERRPAGAEAGAGPSAGRRPGGIMGRLPAAAVLDRTTYRVVAFAFPIWTFAIVAGAIWAEAAWGRYWGWDPKETWSFITWVVYAGYLHARATAGWKGRRAAAVSLLAFSCLFVDYYLVNLVISGLHSYAGL